MQLIYKNSKTKFVLGVLMIMSMNISCKKLVDVDPPITSTSGESVFKDDVTAIGVLTGIYTRLSQGTLNATSGFPILTKKAGLSADELNLWSGATTNDIAYYQNSLSATNQTTGSLSLAAGHELWNACYALIENCNAAIEGLTASTTLTPSVKLQLMGEAKFMRAFLYFYVVNLYGDAPLALTTDFQVNRLLQRAPKSQVYQQIILDLQDAENLLSTTYLNGQLKNYVGTPERVRPTKWAASALLARVYLYNGNGNYAMAEAKSSEVINNSALFSLSTLSNTFLRAGLGNNEAILQLQPVLTSGALYFNTQDAQLFVLAVAPFGLSSSKPVYLNSQLLSSFEVGDNRKTNWVSSYTDGTGTYFFPYKYKVVTAATSVTEYQMILRLAEQYLIRAEARVRQNNISGAQSDLNVVRTRAGLLNTTANTQATLLAAILQERRVELFTEWGHRWLDLKRTGSIDEVMNVVAPLKGGAWQFFKQLWPIPFADLQTNPNLIQNTGY